MFMRAMLAPQLFNWMLLLVLVTESVRPLPQGANPGGLLAKGRAAQQEQQGDGDELLHASRAFLSLRPWMPDAAPAMPLPA